MQLRIVLCLLLLNQYPDGKLPKDAQEIENLVTAEVALWFLREEVFESIKWWQTNSAVPFIKESIEAMRNKVTIIPVKSFYRDEKAITWLRVQAVPSYLKNKDGTKKDAIMLFVPVFFEMSLSQLPLQKKRDHLIQVIIYEYLHIKYDQDHPVEAKDRSKQAAVKAAAAVWAEHIEKILLPMRRAGYYLHPTTIEVVEAYAKHKKDPRHWQTWIRDNRTPFAKPKSKQKR